MTFPPQVEIVDRHVQDELARGAKALVGGNRGTGPGSFYEPTVLVGVDHTMACMREETFGPTLSIMGVRDAEEAVALANDSEFGLQASVWTRDTDRGTALVRRIDAGVVTVNDAIVNYFALELPMGGWKTSGLGTRHGPEGIRKYCKKQTAAGDPEFHAAPADLWDAVLGSSDQAATEDRRVAVRARQIMTPLRATGLT